MTKKRVIAIDMGWGKSSSVWHEDVSPTLTTTHYGEPVVYEQEDDDADGETIFRVARGRGVRDLTE